MGNRFTKLTDRELCGMYLQFWTMPMYRADNTIDKERMVILRDIRCEQALREKCSRKKQEQEHNEWLRTVNQ